jgi:DNA-binding MarR family transcriptional regulator
MTNEATMASGDAGTVWQPEIDLSRRLVLAAILNDNPIPFAYRLNYLANFYVGPLIKTIEQSFRMTRPEWIVLFCLKQRSGLNAQQISNVTGRPKTSISAAVKQLHRKKLISRSTDRKDGRRRVLQITDAGQRLYARILASFVAREAAMTACLTRSERAQLMQLMSKMIDHSGEWARPY